MASVNFACQATKKIAFTYEYIERAGMRLGHFAENIFYCISKAGKFINLLADEEPKMSAKIPIA
jgi:hypothetical protein